MADLQAGDRVRLLIDTPEGVPVEGTVVVVQDNPGKKVGVELDRYAPGGHSLDGLLDAEEKSDPESGITYGKGWWTLEYNSELLEPAPVS